MKIQLFYARAGHGHKKAADVLALALRKKGLRDEDLAVRDALTFTPYYFREPYLAFYYHSVKYAPAVWGKAYEISDQAWFTSLSRGFRHSANRINGQNLVRTIQQEKPKVVVSTHFYSAQLLGRLKVDQMISAYTITIITDVFPHRFWINQGTDLYWCMHNDTKRILIQRGVPADRIIAGGIPIDPAFQPQHDQAHQRRLYHLDPDRFTVLIASGSFGLGKYAPLLRKLESLSSRIQCIVVCGHNHHLQKELESHQFSFPVRVYGFVDFMPSLMEASDIMISKSGGLTTAESLAKMIPMIVTQPIPGQETYNRDFLKQHGCSFFAESADEIKIVLAAILENPRMLKLKQEAISQVRRPNASDDLASHILTKVSSW